MAQLSEVVHISSAYINEVSIRIDSKSPLNREKVRGYVPTQQTAQALETIVKGLTPSSDERVHTVTGAYGTGKSHFGLLLANLLAKWDNDSLEEFWNKFSNKFPQQSEFVKKRLDWSKRFLVVIPDHDPMRDFNQTMLNALSDALENMGLDYMPPSLFEEALTTITTWNEDELYQPRLISALADRRSNIDILVAKLRKYDYEAYHTWTEIFTEITKSRFSPSLDGDAVRIYQNTINDLRSRNEDEFEGIFVIYDEFGVYLQDAAKNPNSKETIQIQDFAEYCKRSGTNQCHFMIIAHQALGDYGLGHRSSKDWEKVYGRFTGNQEITMAVSSTSEAAEELLDTVIVQLFDSALWHDIAKHPDLSMLQDWCENNGLYKQDHSWIRQVVIEGCYPLHPAATYALPWLSERVGQSHRTLFTFLGKDDETSLTKFVELEPIVKNGRLNFFTLDKLFYYFQSGMGKAEYKNILRAREDLLSQTKFDEKIVRIANLLCICEIVKQPVLRPTLEIILRVLHLTPQEENDYTSRLEYLVEHRLLRAVQSDGTYQLRVLEGDLGAQDAIKLIIERLGDNFVQSDKLKKLVSGDSRFDSFIPDQYRYKYFVRRSVLSEVIEPDILQNINGTFENRLRTWYSPSNRTNYEGDALIAYILATNEGDVEAAWNYVKAANWGLQNLFIAIPERPLEIGNLLLQKQAIDYIKQSNFQVDEQTVDSEDLQAISADVDKLIKQQLDAYLILNNFILIDSNGNRARLGTKTGLNNLFSDYFANMFSGTPIIKDDVIMTRIGGRSRDTTKGDRISIMDRLLTSRGMIRIKKSGGQDDRIMRFCFVDTGVLEFKTDLGSEDEYEVREDLPSDSPILHIWKIISDFFDITNIVERKPLEITTLIEQFIAPPYGLSHQFIELFFAAYFRHYRDNFIIFKGAMKARTPQDLRQVEWNGNTLCDMVSTPSDFVLVYVALQPDQKEYLEKLSLTLKLGSDTNLNWDTVYYLLLEWYSKLPSSAKFLENHTEKYVKQFIEAIDRIASAPEDTKDFLWVKIPQIVGVSNQNLQKLEERLRFIIEEIEKTPDRIINTVIDGMAQIFAVEGKTLSSIDGAMQAWYNTLSLQQRNSRYQNATSNYVLEAISGSNGGFKDRLLIELPTKMRISRYDEWALQSVDGFVKEIEKACRDIVDKRYFSEFREPEGDNDDENIPDINAISVARSQIVYILKQLNLSKEEIANFLTQIIDELSE